MSLVRRSLGPCFPQLNNEIRPLKPTACPQVQVTSSIEMGMLSYFEVKIMGIADEILCLRRNQTSSVTLLLGALEWVDAGSLGPRSVARAFAAAEAADIVLLNVAAHAAEAMNEPTTISGARRATLPSRSKRRHGSGPLFNRIQHRLFA
jgi:hypothetical protein